MAGRYAAFISYAHRYEEWVAVLQRNLEVCLRAAGAGTTEIFLDKTDLESGRSWVAQLQEGLSRSDHLILVATFLAGSAKNLPGTHDLDWISALKGRQRLARGASPG